MKDFFHNIQPFQGWLGASREAIISITLSETRGEKKRSSNSALVGVGCNIGVEIDERCFYNYSTLSGLPGVGLTPARPRVTPAVIQI
jgi:hypothetical protein